MTDADLIAEYIARKGVTKCPPAAVAPTTAQVQPIPHEDRTGEEANYKRAHRKRNGTRRWHRQMGAYNSAKSRRRTTQ